MDEVKTPKKPLVYYYGIVLLMLFNFLAMPWLAQRQIREVDYGTFMSMTENREKLDDLARFLYEKETITGGEFMDILNS